MILASNSPRRRELLAQMGIDFKVITSEIDENINETDPEAFTKKLSYKKAKHVAEKNPGEIVLGADTIVVCEGKILGKPRDEKDAFDILKQLSGKTHQVYTAVTLIYLSGKTELKNTFVECTDVEMYENSDEMIKRYIESKEPMDKAGAYGIQGLGAMLVKKINGDYYNVVGLPIARVVRQLDEMESRI